ncbi:Tyrosine-protein kinase ptk [bacterium HR17]|uniref:Tyrosine-protein kinase ptk n=1 Tax=Candidatus Fervidibacter japonicus TaxID=2035412 RepID=A0A2H5XBI3_9BACT|nr:Tyrosine-protein kinase ptk [bacterium HR17]
MADSPTMDEHRDEPEAFSLERLLWVLRQRWQWVVVAPIVCVAATLVTLPFLPRLYEATSLVRVRQPAAQSGLSSMLSNWGINPSSPPSNTLSLKTVERLVRTRSCARQALALLRRRNLPALPRPLDESAALKTLRTKTTEPDILEITVRFPDPRWASALANAFALALSQRLAQDATSDITQQRRYLERHVQALERQLQDLDAQIAATKRRLGFTDIVKETEAIVKALYEAEAERSTLQAQLATADQTAERLRRELERQQPLISATVVRQDPIVQQLRQQLAQLEVQRADYLVRYTPEHIALRQLDATIRTLQREIAQRARQLVREPEVAPNPAYQLLWQSWVEAETNRFAMAARLQGLSRLTMLLRERLASLPESQRRFAALLRQQQALEQVYANLLVQLETNRLQEATQTRQVVVVDLSTPPKAPVSPRPLLSLVMAVTLGTIMGFAFALIWSTYTDTVQTPDELRRALDAPLVCSFPQVKTAASFLAWMQSSDSAAETVRLLRANLKFLGDGHQFLRCLLVTSPHGGEGKTFIATALATAWAQAGYQTVLVDWRHTEAPHPLLNVTSRHALPISADDPSAIAEGMVPTSLPNLWLISARQSAEVSSDTERLAPIFAHLRERADIVVVDAPPILTNADALLLVPLSDGVVVVAEASRTTRNDLQKVREQVRLARGRIVAAVLNKASST